MKLKNLNKTLVLILCLQIGYSCDSKSDTPALDLKLAQTNLVLTEGENVTVGIISGNGDYKTSTSPTEIVMARPVDNNEIRINALKKGTTTITVIDAKNKSATIAVEVDVVPIDPKVFIIGTTKPRASNTGLNVEGIDPITMEVVEGTMITGSGGKIRYEVIHTTDGAVYENIRFTCAVIVKAKNVTYKNCWFNPVSIYGGGGGGMVRTTGQEVSGIKFENCLFKPSDKPTSVTEGASNCIFGHNFTLERCDLSGAIDGVGLYSGDGSRATPARNVKILGSYIHDLTYFFEPPGTGHSDNQTHNDCVQIHYGAADFEMYGTTAEAYIDKTVGNANEPPTWGNDGKLMGGCSVYPNSSWMAVFMATPASTTAGVKNFKIDSNWIGGGVVYINWHRSDADGLYITNNRWMRGNTGARILILKEEANKPTTVIQGNYYEDIPGKLEDGWNNG